MPQTPRFYLHTYSLRFHLQLKPGYDVHAFIDQAAADGFDGVCISANDPNYRHLGGREAWRLPPIRERLAHHRLRLDLDTSGTDPEHLRQMLGVAAALGADHLRTYTRYDGPPETIVQRSIADLQAAAPLAAAHGVVILLENHEMMTGAEIARVLQAVDSPWVAALYDYGNSQMVLEDPLQCLADMAPWARSAHLKDHVVLRPEDAPDGRLSILGVPIGEGNLPLLAQTRRLLAAGCQRIVFENSWGYRAPVKPERITPAGMALLGQGAFAYAEPPLSPPRFLLHPERLPPAELVAMEAEMHRRTWAWARGTLGVGNLDV